MQAAHSIYRSEGLAPVPLTQLLSSMRRMHGSGAASIKLQAVLLLAGAVRTTAFTRAVNRCLLDLPITVGMTLLDLWGAHFQSMVERLPGSRFRVLLDQQSPVPMTRLTALGDRFSLEHDPLPFRGTGGLLRDVVRDYDTDDFVLAADAAQVLTRPLPEILSQLRSYAGDVVLAADARGQAAGIMLIRCGVLRDVQPVGYADLKEQVLPALRQRGAQIKVCSFPKLPTMAVRSAADYLKTTEVFHTRSKQRDDVGGGRHFEVVECSSSVAPGAEIYDSVVLRGAVVRSGARVIRSIVGPGAVIRAGERVSDQLVAADARLPILEN